MTTYPTFRYIGDKITGYDVSTASGVHLGRVERTDPSGRPDTRPSGWVAKFRTGWRSETVYRSRAEAADRMLTEHIASLRKGG